MIGNNVVRFVNWWYATLLIAVTVSLFLLSLVPAEGHTLKNVLVLHSYHQGLKWTDQINAGIEAQLRSMDRDIEIYYEYLDTKRNSAETYLEQMAQYLGLKSKLAGINFDVIISSDNNALRFLIDYGDAIYPNAPIVFCGINDFTPELLGGKIHITGVVESINYAATLDAMHRLHPTRSRVLIVLDNTPTGKAIKKEVAPLAVQYQDHFQFEYYQDFLLDEVPDKISALGSDAMIYVLTFNKDRAGNFISYTDGIRMIRSAANVPIYGSWDFFFGNGIIGGMITSGYAQGETAARLATQILDGTPPEQIPIVTKSPNRYMFDYSEMARFGLTPADLPPGSHIENLPPGLFVRHKKKILSIVAILAAIAILLGWRLIVQRHRARALVIANRELDRRVAEQTAAIREKNTLLESEILVRTNAEERLLEKTGHLENALAKVKTLNGMLPICSNCKKIRDDQGYWNQIESYINKHSEATFSHGICPECIKKLYPYYPNDDHEKQ